MIFLLLTVFLFSGQARAADLPDELFAALPEMAGAAAEAGSLEQGLALLLETARGELRSVLHRGIAGAVRLMLVLLLCSVGEGAMPAGKGGGSIPYVTIAGTVAILLLAAGDIRGMMGLGAETVTALEQFSKVLLPVLAAATAASGHVGAASVKQVATVFFSDMLLTLIRQFLLPMTYLFIGLLAANTIVGENRLEKLCSALKGGITWVLKTALLLFTTYLAVAGVVAGTADAAAVKAARSAIAGVVPVVGGVMANAAETVLAGAAMLRGSIGVFGILAVLGTCLVPFVRLGVQYLLYKAVSLAAFTIGPKPLAGLLEGLGSAFGIILGMTGSAGLLLLISVISSLLVVTL